MDFIGSITKKEITGVSIFMGMLHMLGNKSGKESNKILPMA